MKKTLYLKFLIAYAIFAVFGFVIISTFMQQLTRDEITDDKAHFFYTTVTTIADTYGAGLYNNEISLTALKDELDNVSIITDAAIWIVNPSGLIVVDSASPLDVENPVTIEGFDPAANAGSYYSVGNYYGYFNQKYLNVSATITSGFNVVGYVVAHYDYSKIQAEVNKYLNIDYILLAVLFLLSMIILIFFTEIVYMPLKKITKATEQYAGGNLHYNLQVESDDEIGYLAASLAYMAGELAKGEDNQKQLVANVSHDFRSPLTSIKGYLEAMNDGTIPEEMHEKYINIVLNETDRLIKLTNNLLTLNNLNTEGMVLELTDFDINSVARQTISTFEGRCVAKKIAVELTLTGEEMYVHADKTRIQQVIYNLIDNAIKFSNNNSVIKIETTEKHDKLFVSVKDSGIGIPKESVALVFDRFYKTDLSRGKDKRGTGLGLSITKEIIRAHGENINVISTEGVGTEFIFSLPISKDMKEE